MQEINKILFISPEYNTSDVNGVIENLFINNIDKKITPYILCKNASSVDLTGKIIVVKQNSKIRYFENIYQKKLLIPDAYFFSWVVRVIIKDIFTRRKIDYSFVHSFSVPYSSHLLAYYLKKKYKIRWIAQFYEPWLDNNYLQLDRFPLYKKMVVFWETLVARNADIIIHNSDVAKEVWMKRYGDIVKDKLYILNLPFKPDYSNPKSNSRPNDKIIFTHIGNLYNLRNAETIIRGVDFLRKQNKEVYSKILVYLVGSVQKKDIELINNLRLTDVIEVVGKISEEGCRLYYLNSSAFVAIDGENQGTMFFPSKIIKYFFYNRPILGVTDENSVLNLELQKAGHTSIRHHDYLGVSLFIQNIVDNDPRKFQFEKDYWKRFDVSKISQDYLAIVRQFANKKMNI